MYSRRDFGKIAAAALPLSAAFGAKINSKVNGVPLGSQSYSFRDVSLDDAIKGMVEGGCGYCELFAGHIEPPALGHAPAIAGRGPGGGRGRGRGPQDPAAMAAANEARLKAREDVRKWRLTVDLGYFKNVKKQFDDAGIQLQILVLEELVAHEGHDEPADISEAVQRVERESGTRIDATKHNARRLVRLHRRSPVRQYS